MGSNPTWGNRIAESYPDLESLLQAAEDVRGTLASPGWAHVIRLIEAEVSEIDAGMDGRALSEHADYAFRHGRRGGLLSFLEAADAIVARSEAKLAVQREKHEGVGNPALVRSAA